jgi:formate-dependent nitrite reductase membrane component NrfD
MPTAAVALLFMGLTGVLLVADLKQPQRFVYVLLRPQWRSWLVRGAYLITAYGALLLPTIVASAMAAPEAVQLALGWATNLLAVSVAVYTAFLFAQAKGRDYWQNPLLVAAMLVDALVCGVVAMTLLGWAGWSEFSAAQARLALGLGLGASALLLLAEFVPTHQTLNAERTARLILRGPFASHFWLGVVVTGLLLPAVLVASGTLLPLAVLLALAGVVLRNHVLVQAPQRIPLS